MNHRLFGLKYHTLNLSQTVHKICSSIDENKKIVRADINVGTITSSQRDIKLQEFINSSDIVNIDGAGAILGAKILRLPVPERITGVDLFMKLIEVAQERAYSIYLLGSTKETLESLKKILLIEHPKLKLVGVHDGYFWGHEDEVIAEINSLRPNILFIGIKSPEKEYFQLNYANILNVNLIMGVGGSFDVAAGKVKRAPAWIQNMCLEWLFRVYQEPKRMWKRYLTSNLLFTKMLIAAKLKKL